MAAALKRARWQEEEALSSHHMLSLHQMFERLGSQLSQADVDALELLLPPEREPPVPLPKTLHAESENVLCSPMFNAEIYWFIWMSPERCHSGGPVPSAGEQMESCLNSERSYSTQSEWESGTSLRKRQSTSRRRGRGAGKRRGRKGHVLRNREEREHQSPHQPRATCDIRLRVRAVYSDQNTVLRGNVVSVKQDPLDRCFDLFGQANTILKSRDLGSIICDIKFSELSYLDAFWNDYINGSLLEALKGVFITDSLKQAVGQEAIQLLVNVDEDDYEKGRRVLLQNISP
ncbi:DNA-binding death effector domain-containing protein 2-like [Scyliorhinus torazame]|uniref:DNA-binding death effector domain-containing protein 2-like n=1 Tax=Scyliorhinus torazame TaxID=75743 RepID=UPI003B5C6A30